MHSPSNDLRNALVTQKSKRQPLLYDRIQNSINQTIATLQQEHKNAIVRNLAYNINGQLVLAQLFVNRLNGFVPTEEAKFGTTPTAYNIQLRFVHGYETTLGAAPIFISNGSFAWSNLVPREIGDHVTDDIYHEMTIIRNPGVTLKSTSQTVSLSIPDTETISLPTNKGVGKGYEDFSFSGVPARHKYYFKLQDYQQRHKLNAVYALWYAQPEQNEVLCWHPEYQGHTQAQGGVFEARDGMAATRKRAYQNWIQGISGVLRQNKLGNQWIETHQRSREEHNPYRLDILSVNGMYLYSDTGLVVDRLYDYQVELVQLFTTVYQSIRSTNQPNRLPQDAHASIVDMGVGAGKTYIINTVLKSISRFYKEPNFAPAYCMTPDPALANVMVRVINKQAGVSQIISTAITSSVDIPNATFLRRYQLYAQTAVSEITTIKKYVFGGLQNDILEYCRQVGLHPFVIMNELYTEPHNCQLYQNSIDIKRLLLLIEGQKLIIQKTGLSPVIALRRLADELEKIIQGVDKEKSLNNPLFIGIDQPIHPLYPAEKTQITYDRTIDLPLSLRSDTMRQLNLKDMTAGILKRLLLQKFSYKRDLLQKSVAIRDVLLKIACLSDSRAAILLANGGGLANTHTFNQVEEQIEFLLEPAALELRRGAQKKEPMTYLEHRTYFLYLNEIFATIPEEIDARARYRNHRNYSSLIREMSLRHNYQLLHQLRSAIQQQIAQLTPSEETDHDDGSTMVEAANHMAGKVGLVLVGRLDRDAAKLLSTHVPVFTPEGFVAYLEYLVQSQGQPLRQVQYREGIYLLEPAHEVISRQSIQQRLVQIMSAMMVADEIHKEAYQFLYDSTHPLYQRANDICRAYLNQEFGKILPHRMGMSGTVNQIAKSAFGQEILYSLPLQDMIQRRLTKDFRVTSLTLAQSAGIGADYFKGNAWWGIAKGILFSKQSLHKFEPTEFTEDQGSRVQMQAIRNQLFVHYLEFVLQKSGAFQELSEIAGVQNTLFARNVSLLDAFQDHVDILQNMIRSIRGVSPDLISETDVRQYVQRSIHDPDLQASLAELIMRHKNDYLAMSLALSNSTFALHHFITSDPHAFEDGLSQVLIGSEAQQTGYSHEFVGAIVDASIWDLEAQPKKFELNASTDFQAFYEQLQDLLAHSFSYDEKNQIAGRALRTSSGTASYIEYLSPNYDRDFIFNIETSFTDILLEDKEQANRLRASVSLNRMVLSLLEEFDGPFETFVSHVLAHCQTRHLVEDFRGFLAERLPAWWALKCQEKRLSETEAVVLSGIVAEQLSSIQIADRRKNSWQSRVVDHNFGPEGGFSAANWLHWMAQSSLPIAIGAVLLVAGLSTLSALSIGLVASTLLLNYGAVGLTVVGSALLLPVLSKTCLAFFQKPPEGNNQGSTVGQTLGIG